MAIKPDKKGEVVFTLDCREYTSNLTHKLTRNMIESMNFGHILEVIFDKPSSIESITEICSGSGNQIIDKKVDNGKYIYRIKKGQTTFCLKNMERKS